MSEAAETSQTSRTDRMMLCLALGLFMAETTVLAGLFWI